MTAQHGTRERYRQHVLAGEDSCAACREAERVEKARYRARLARNGGPLYVDPTGTRRRLRALAAIGWDLNALAAELRCHRSNVGRFMQRSKVHADSARAVREVYERLSMTLGPSEQARKLARGKGWPPPLAWDDDEIDNPAARPIVGYKLSRTAGLAFDDIAVARAMRGEKVALRPVERAEAVRRLTAAGVSVTEIAARLRVEPRTVQRLRSAA